MEELVLASYIKVMQESFTKNNKQEAAGRLILDSILSQEAACCCTDITPKKVSNIVKRKDPVPDDIAIASANKDVISSVHVYFSEIIMKEINPHLKLDLLEKMKQLINSDIGISTEKKKDLLKFCDDKLYARFLSEVFLYTLGRDNKELKKQEGKRLLYKSSLVIIEKANELLDASNIKILSSIEDVNKKEVYRLNMPFTFTSRYNADGRRVVDIKTTIGIVNICGETSSENWVSRSYLNNATKANSVFCTAVFEVLDVKGNKCRVQYLVIGDDV